jgi:hypothetical protein
VQKSDKLRELIRYDGGVATRAEAAEGLLRGGVPFAWVIRYLSDTPTLTPEEGRRLPGGRVRFSQDRQRDELGRFAPTGKAAHEMTADEFAAAVPGRVERKPAQGIDDWAKSRGREADLAFGANDINVANLIGGALTESTRHGRGKVKTLISKLADYNRLTADYNKSVASGEVPMVEKLVPLDTVNSKADQAYVRSMHKRAIRKALSAGLTVPPEVSKDYPEFQGESVRGT